MSYPKINAPLTLRRGYVDSTPVVFNLTEQPGGVLLSWTNAFGGSIAHAVQVGKEYGDAATRYHDYSEIPADLCGMYPACIPDPNTVQPVGYTHDCWSGVSDQPIAFAQPFDTDGNLLGVSEIFIPFNKFQLAASTCAIQTDGKEANYYVELSQVVGAAAVHTKWTFKYTSPVAPFIACGAGQVVVPPPPPATPAKGNKPKKN